MTHFIIFAPRRPVNASASLQTPRASNRFSFGMQLTKRIVGTSVRMTQSLFYRNASAYTGMGVKDLWPILSPGETALPLSALKGKTLAVDLSGWVVESHGAKGLAAAVKKPHLRNLVFRTLCLCRLGVKLVFVLDGAATELKWEAMDRRERGRGRGCGCGRGGARKTGARPVLNMNLREVSVHGQVVTIWW